MAAVTATATVPAKAAEKKVFARTQNFDASSASAPLLAIAA